MKSGYAPLPPHATRDPARFSFAHGCKDGFPYPVDRQTREKTIAVLERALEGGTIDRGEKVQALKRLTAVTSSD